MNIWQALDLLNQRQYLNHDMRININLGHREVQILLDRRGLFSATDCNSGDQLVPPTDETTLVTWLRKVDLT